MIPFLTLLGVSMGVSVSGHEKLSWPHMDRQKTDPKVCPCRQKVFFTSLQGACRIPAQDQAGIVSDSIPRVLSPPKKNIARRFTVQGWISKGPTAKNASEVPALFVASLGRSLL